VIYLDLILNLTLLVALTIVSGFIEKSHPHKTRTGLLIQGLLFGSAAIIGMLRPLDFGNGVIFDGRSVMISLCALYFGPRAVAVAAGMAILCRIGLAGGGMVTGILTILSSAGLGLGARLRYQPEVHPPSSGFLYAFGLIVHLAMMALMFTLPEGAGARAVVQIGPPVLLLYPLATILAGKILTDQLVKQQAMEALRESEQRNRALLNAMPDILFQFDGNGVFLDYYAPPQVPLLLPPERFLKRSVNEIFPGELAENTMACIAAARRDGMAPPFAYQLEINGQALHFESRIVACGEERFLSVVRDITDQKRAQEALQEKNREMERFVYSVSHDLRSPLVTITSFLELLREDITAGDNEAIGTDLRYMKASAVKMEQLLDTLLQLSRAGYASTRAEEVNFREIVDESVAAVKGALLQKNVEVEVAAQDIILRGDPLNLSQIWQNLIGNAVKYMGDQPSPKIEVGILPAENEGIFFVSDNGMGIEPGNLKKVFDMFEKLDGSSDGPGLGLALVKRIVESYQGRIWVESQGAGGGSCFKFTLPQALSEPKRATE
jgi:PAS domain S-box-containing protein